MSDTNQEQQDSSNNNNNDSSCLKKFKAFDLFKFNGEPRHIAGYQASVMGVIGTILLLAIVGGYIGNSTYRFFTTPPQTSVTQNPTHNERLQMVDTCFTVPKMNDPRYFARAIWRIHLDEDANKTQIRLNFTEIGEDTVCVSGKNESNSYLRAFCSPGNCDFLRFKLWNCGCPDKNVPADLRRNISTECASLDDVNGILNSSYVDVSYDTPLAQVVQHTSPKLEASAVYMSTFAINKTMINPDLIRSFETAYDHNLVFQRESYHLQYFFLDGVPKKEVLEVQMALSSHVLVTVENRQTALDMIGAWGAFFSVIAGAGAAVFGKYNEKKFYERNPKWEKVDEHFRVEEGSDKNLLDESRKLLANETTSANLFHQAHNMNAEGFGRVSGKQSRYGGGGSQAGGNLQTYGDVIA